MALEWKRLDLPSNEQEAYGWDRVMGIDPAANWLSGPAQSRFLPFESLEKIRVPMLVSLFWRVLGTAEMQEQQALLRNLLEEMDYDSEPFFRDLLLKLVEENVGLISLPADVFDLETKATEDFIEKLRALPNGFNMAISSPHAPDIPEFISHQPPQSPPPVPDGGWPAEGPNGENTTVVMGVIDDAIGFAHEAFRDRDGKSRVHAIWRQEAVPVSGDVPLGEELLKCTGAGIDVMLQDAQLPSGQVDEDKLYRDAGFIDFSNGTRQLGALRFTHGTHVMDIAAGHHPSEDRIDRPIVAVQLPPEVVEQSSGTEMDLYAVTAIEYILSRAEWLSQSNKPLPVVITMSYGFIAGPHDGTTRLEKAIDARLETYRKKHEVQAELVLSAGNSHLSRCHTSFAFEDVAPPLNGSQNKSVLLEWRILPDDKTDSFVEVWLPQDDAIQYNPSLNRNLPDDQRIRVRVTAPDGTQSGWVTGVNGHTERLVAAGQPAASKEALAEMKYLFAGGETNRAMFRITVGPTAMIETALMKAAAPAGIWKIEIEKLDMDESAPIACWVQRDDTIYGYPQRGRQSYFENGGYALATENGIPIVEDSDVLPDALVRRRSLVSAMATGETPIVVGAYDAKDHRLADYSSGGPVTKPATDPRPNVLGIGDWSRVGYGILAAGGKSGSVVASNGTSAAAPYVARLLADWLVAGENKNGLSHAKKQAEDNEVNLPSEAPELSDERSGWGRFPVAGSKRRIQSERLRGNDKPEKPS